MTFEEHLEATRADDGTFDEAAAEASRAAEIATSDDMETVAKKAAHAERLQWERSQRDRRAKVFEQATLVDTDSLEVHVPLYEGRTIKVGDLDSTSLRLRKDRRATTHAREAAGFAREIQWIDHQLLMLTEGQTIREFYAE